MKAHSLTCGLLLIGEADSVFAFGLADWFQFSSVWGKPRGENRQIRWRQHACRDARLIAQGGNAS